VAAKIQGPDFSAHEEAGAPARIIASSQA